MAEKYEFDPELKMFDNMKPPIVPILAPVWQKLMGYLYHMEKSNPNMAVTKLLIPAEDGSSIQAMEYAPWNVPEHAPCLLFLHGGGWVYRGSPHHFVLAHRFAMHLNCKVIFVDYRLAPIYKFPIAVEDCFTVYQWVLEHAESLNIDPARIAVCGDSAGGNLSAVLCLMARDKGIQMPRAQMLLYPVTDYRMETESYRTYTDTPMCNSRDMEKYYKMYVNKKKLEHMPLAYLSPMEADTLEGLPAAYVEVAQYDCLRDEGIAYGQALRKAGVQAEIHETKNAMHGYDIAVNSKLTKEHMKRRIHFLREQLEA